jgi:membrane associated rhomboid family serine protease
MGIYNRDYFRESRRGSWGLEELTPVVKYLIWANVVVYLLQIVVVREVPMTKDEFIESNYGPEIAKVFRDKQAEGAAAYEAFLKEHEHFKQIVSHVELQMIRNPTKRVPIVQEWLELDTNKVVYGGQVWRLITHAFCHARGDYFHILFNMIFLYWFGSTIEARYGRREFLRFYLAGALAAALAFVGLDLYTGSTTPAIGASGAVMAVVMLYTLHYPYQTIFLFWVLPMEMRWVMAGYILLDLHPFLLTLGGDRVFDGIAHAAHLGGALFGFLYWHYHWQLDGLLGRIGVPSLPRWGRRRRPRLRVVSAPPPEPDEMSRVDELLQKIFELGQESLTEEERAILHDASERIRNRQRGG